MKYSCCLLDQGFQRMKAVMHTTKLHREGIIINRGQYTEWKLEPVMFLCVDILKVLSLFHEYGTQENPSLRPLIGGSGHNGAAEGLAVWEPRLGCVE